MQSLGQGMLRMRIFGAARQILVNWLFVIGSMLRIQILEISPIVSG